MFLFDQHPERVSHRTGHGGAANTFADTALQHQSCQGGGGDDRIVGQIRARCPRVRILLRADSGFCRETLMAWCEANRVGCVFGLARNDRLASEIVTEWPPHAPRPTWRNGEPDQGMPA